MFFLVVEYCGLCEKQLALLYVNKGTPGTRTVELFMCVRCVRQNMFFNTLHGQPQGTFVESARLTLFIEKKKIPKSKPCLRHQPTCTCCVPICKSCYRKRQTSKSHRTSQPISLSLARRSGMASQLLLLLRLT